MLLNLAHELHEEYEPLLELTQRQFVPIGKSCKHKYAHRTGDRELAKLVSQRSGLNLYKSLANPENPTSTVTRYSFEVLQEVGKSDGNNN